MQTWPSKAGRTAPLHHEFAGRGVSRLAPAVVKSDPKALRMEANVV